ncbi:ATP-binding protein [Nisaea sp.]|uniref:ATP-binding protein n=1 Tax=Nisaea sp. TaxID=2024842 RepID=UPI003B526FF7
MMIRTQIRIAILVSMALLSIAGAVAVWSFLTIERSSAQLEQVSDLEKTLHQMKDIAGEFDERFAARFVNQWAAGERKVRSMVEGWGDGEFLSDGGKFEAIQRLNQMSANFDRLAKVRGLPESTAGSESLFRARLNSNADAVIGRIDRVIGTLRNQQEAAQVVVFVSVLVCILVAAANIWLFYSLVLRPVLSAFEQLSGEAGRIGQGDLHAAVDVRYRGEIAEAFQSLEAMRSQLARLTDDLVAQRAEAEAAGRAKTEFLANMSHELRTPLNAVIGYADLLQESDHGVLEPGKQRAYASAIGGSGRHLLSLINDVLDFAKIDSDKLTINPEMFDFRTEIENIHSAFREKAGENNVDLVVDASNVPRLIESDQTRVRQILYNLVGNAVKFTSDGEVHVSVSSERKSGRRTRLAICVRDEGIGIASDRIEQILDPFSQADNSVSRKFGGTGLGLPITKRLAEALGGGLSIESTPGKGSVFIASIMVDDYSDVAEAVRGKESDGRSSGRNHGYGLHVLVVDDVSINREVAGELLKRFGCSYDAAQDGMEAVEKAQSGAYDIILLDVHMPRMDGKAAMKAIRELEKKTGKHVRIYAWTADVLQIDSQSAKTDGWSGTILKPVSNDELETVLASVAKDLQKADNVHRLDYRSGQRL